MEIRFRCPACSALNEVEVSALTGEGTTCAACTKKIDLDLSEAIQHREVVDRCPICNAPHLYVQKDFNQKLGLGIVVCAGIIGLIFVALDRPLGFYLSLLAAVVLDALLYLLLPKVTICYACRSEFRAFRPNPENGPFDLKIADVYDRKRKSSPAP
ncbi:MAG: hypothetical protein EXS64_11750 [Candidatus Latescibacteria bacterium]|nr:hypothetical protein [Candidatus Latescibacterota bacterium]